MPDLRYLAKDFCPLVLFSVPNMYILLSKTHLKRKMPLDVHLWRAFFWTEHFCLASRHTTYQICYIQCCGVFFSPRIPKVEKPYNDDLLHGCQTFWPLAVKSQWSTITNLIWKFKSFQGNNIKKVRIYRYVTN